MRFFVRNRLTDRQNAGITCPDEFIRIAKVQALLQFGLGVLQAINKIGRNCMWLSGN